MICNRAIEIINRTRINFPDYFGQILLQRLDLPKNTESYYPGIYNTEDLFDIVVSLPWSQTNIYDKILICKSETFVAPFPGISNNRKKTGFLHDNIVFSEKKLKSIEVPFSTLVTGKKYGQEIVFDIYPGAPTKIFEFEI